MLGTPPRLPLLGVLGNQVELRVKDRPDHTSHSMNTQGNQDEDIPHLHSRVGFLIRDGSD